MYEQLVSILKQKSPLYVTKIHAFEPFEIFLFLLGYKLVAFSALNKAEPERRYKKGDEIVSVILDTRGEHVIQLNDNPILYYLPTDYRVFKKALQGKLSRV